MFSNIKIVLVETSHPGNIGAAMRAMETMGLDNLTLVSPRSFEHPDVLAMASNATIVAEKVSIVDNLLDSLADTEIIIGTSARTRSISLPTISARECGRFCLENEHKKIAILFGPERTGLTNEQLMACNKQVYIPTSNNYVSLNLAMAVQVISYEIKLASMEKKLSSDPQITDEELASYQEVQLFYEHLEQVLTKIAFFHNSEYKKLNLKLKRLFNRINLEKTEINILRGILGAIDKYEK